MLYSKKQKISIILFLFAIIILTLFLIKFQLDPIFEESTINRGVEAYFDISNANKTIFYFLALIIITPNLFTTILNIKIIHSLTLSLKESISRHILSK